MIISSLASSSGLQQQNIRKTDAKLQAAIASLVSGKAKQDVADLAIASQLQSRVAGLKQVSQNLAQATSLTQVADGAVTELRSIIGRLQEIALQAGSGAVSDDNRTQLDKEFQSLLQELDVQAADVKFNGKNLLDGSLSGENALSLGGLLADGEAEEGGSGLSINSLSTLALFGGDSLDVLSADGAARALAALDGAQSAVGAVAADIGSFQQTLNYAAASIDSAIINQQAAQSLLSDADFLESASESQQAQVQRNAQLSLAAQGNRLPSALLQLIS